MNKYQRRRGVAVLVLLMMIAAIGFRFVSVNNGSTLNFAQIAAKAQRARLAALAKKEYSVIARAKLLVNVALPSHEGASAPATPAKLFVRPLIRHLVVGFVPYWTVPTLVAGGQASVDITDSTELVYSSVCVGKAGTLITLTTDCANGMAGLASPAFGSFMQLAHMNGVRVLLSVQTIDPAIIHSLGTHAATLAPTLEQNLSALVSTYGFDGINLDIEGRGPANRVGYVNFVRDFSRSLKSANPSLDLMVDTYPQSAASSSDFYDVARLSHYVDQFFVMAYAMENGKRSSANSPLGSATLGWSAAQTLVQYRAVVPANKIILGMPFYGLNFATKTNLPGSKLVSDAPSARLYSAVVAAGRPALWDVASATPYSVFRESDGWHQDWYDNSVSLALKTALAQVFHIAGVGVWAMSMEGGDLQMLNALTGENTPLKLPLATSVSTG
ncbi:MAG TPA: glycosyl hydrolase family 18 protein [Acidimicrobiales bacterium]|nr:glycosyl hydrolase family 18 protein [Acidimicrobiales bacterium]